MNIFFFFILLRLIFIYSYIYHPSERKFLWNTHSYNDIRLFKQLILKGSNYFKIDLYYKSYPNCKTNDIRSLQNKDGCFILTHDEPNKNVNYDSIYDFLDILIKYRQYFQNTTYPNVIFLCFKHLSKACKTLQFKSNKRARKWIRLVDEIYNYIEIMKKQFNLTIEFVYDALSPLCIRKKWDNFNSTYTYGREDKNGLFLNDKSLFYYKFSYLNLNEKDVENVAKVEYGKFLNKSNPILIWEPDKQKKILKIANILNSYSQHINGYAFSINIDPIRYQIYISPSGKEGLNYNILKDKNYSMYNSTFFINNNLVHLFLQNQNEHLVYDIKLNKTIYKNQFLFSNLENYKYQRILETIYLGKNSKDLDIYLMLFYNGDFNINQMDSNFEIKKNKQFSLYDIQSEILNKKIDYLLKNSSTIINRYNKRVLYNTMFYIYINSPSCSIIEKISNNDIKLICISGQNNYKLSLFLFQINLNNIDIKILKFFSFQVKDKIIFKKSLHPLQIKCNLNKTCIIAFSSYKDFILSYKIEFSNNYSYKLTSFKNLNVGKNFHLSVLGKKFFVVIDNGFCYNFKNRNLCNLMLCDYIPKLYSNNLNYIFGNIDMDKELNTPASPCESNEYIYGSYDMGNNPKVQLFLDKNNTITFLEIHDGIHTNLRGNSYKCGISKFYSGIVIDSIKLFDFDKLNKH